MIIRFFLFILLSLSFSEARAQIARKTIHKQQSHAKSKVIKRASSLVKQPKYAAIVMDADSGEVMHSDQANELRYPASLTKMMTLYIVFESLRKGNITLDTPMTVSQKASEQAPTKLGLHAGEVITVKTAILALVTKSANDASMVIAENLAGSEEAFAHQMNRKARALGMTRSIFKNPHGLPNMEQVTTAYDMAVLSRALYRDFPGEYKYFSTTSFTHRGTAHRNHNHLLGKVWGVDGIKTGLTNASGFNLAASAVRHDEYNKPRRLITVVMGGPNRHWRDRRVEQLLETHFAQFGAESKGFSSKSTVNKDNLPELSTNELIYEIDEDDDEEGGIELFSRKENAFANNPLNDLIHEVHMETNNAQSTQKNAIKVRPATWVTPVPKENEGVKKAKITKVSRKSGSQKKMTAVKSSKICKKPLTPTAIRLKRSGKVGAKRLKKSTSF